MATRKNKHFSDGGETTDYLTAEEAEGSRSEEAAPATAEAAPMPKKAPVVTKEQLAKSGMSLRDYMNKQMGLTRRGESSAPALAASTNSAVRKTDTAKASKRPSLYAGPRADIASAVQAAKNRFSGAADRAERRGVEGRAAAKDTMDYYRNDKEKASGMKKGGRVTGYKGYGIAKKV